MLKMKRDFNDSFDTQCQEKSVPIHLLALYSFLGVVWPRHHGSVQLCIYASTSSHPLTATCVQQFSMPGILPPQVDLLLGTAKTSLTPLPNYLGILVHTKSHKRALMNTLFNLGLCISYDQVLDLSTELGNKIYNHSVLLNSRVSCLLPSQSTISTTIPVL